MNWVTRIMPREVFFLGHYLYIYNTSLDSMKYSYAINRKVCLPVMEHIDNKTFEESFDDRDFALGAEFAFLVDEYNKWEQGEPGARRQSLLVLGPHGFGKTGYTTDFFSRLPNTRVVNKSLSQTTPENFFIPVPTKGELKVEKAGDEVSLETLLLEELKPQYPGEKVILFLDELNRVPTKAIFNLVMEVSQEYTIAGVELPHLMGVVCAANPPGDPGRYAGVLMLDYAQADRFHTVILEENDTPWRHYLAYKFPHLDLNAFFETWECLERQIRLDFPPRLMEFFLRLDQERLPQQWALPFTAQRLQLMTISKTDVTDKVLEKFAASIGSSMHPYPEKPLDAALKAAIKNKWSIRLLGDPGIGKTSAIKALISEAKLDSVYFSLSQVSPEDMAMPVPRDGKLYTLLMKRLKRTMDEKYTLILDEFSRAQRRTAAAAMELTNNHAIAGQPLQGLSAVVAIDNKPQVGSTPLDTGRIDDAQASRFVLTLELSPDNTGWQAYLRKKYGEEFAQAFIDWRAEDVRDPNRWAATPRCLERLMKRENAGLPLADAVPVIGAARAPITNQLLLLRRRLEGVSLGLREILDDLPKWLAFMEESNPDNANIDDPAVIMKRQQILTLLRNVDTKKLVDAQQEFKFANKMVLRMSRQERISILRSAPQEDPTRLKLWTAALSSIARKKAKAKKKK